MAGECMYSCETATQTEEWIKAIVDFLRPFSFLINAHVVNFFTDRLWEAVDQDWIDCLRRESIDNLLLIPSGVVQDHWPISLKQFVLTSHSLVFPRNQADLQTIFPGLQMTSLSSVLAQGMNKKKRHEVEILSALVSSEANNVRAQSIVDVGSGQGYLAQVLSFQYQHSVVAVDACSHHGKVTASRAERIKKHYTAQMRKSGLVNRHLNVPKTITCRVMSMDMLNALTNGSVDRDDVEQPRRISQNDKKLGERELQSAYCRDTGTSLVLAGLHACGDLSVTMLKTFSECEEVKAVVSIGCCYNLLSQENSDLSGSVCGFPMSCGVKCCDFPLGKNSRDLACQSAERWRMLESDAGVHNFELHAFRAAFQMVLNEYYPEAIIKSPSVGRQGKALRRQQQQRRIVESQLHFETSEQQSFDQEDFDIASSSLESAESIIGGCSVAVSNGRTMSHRISLHSNTRSEGSDSVGKYALFEKFCHSGLCRLGLEPIDHLDLCGVWDKLAPFTDIIGPYWSLRAALGPLLETLILLDRLLFLQEQSKSLEAVMLPIFDPVLSPRNVAIIARRK